MEVIPLAQGDSLYEPNEQCRYVYFPEAGVAAILNVLEDGRESEVATVGNEGVVGLPAFFGAATSSRRAFWQMSGTAVRMNAGAVQQETRRNGALARALRLYSQALFTQLAQQTTCNRLHTIKQRCCCWLLLTHDRVEGDEFAVTHEFLSQMLGTRRAGVTVIAGALQRARIIRYWRGRITIRNRAKLEKAACECYRTIRAEFDRLLG
jgi:CRP-like cAMP-binding protein